MARPLAPACLRPNGIVDPTALLGVAALLSGQLRSTTLVSTSVPYGTPSSLSFSLTTPALTPFPAALQPYVTAPGTSYGIPPPLVPLAPPSFGVVVVRVLLHDGQLVRSTFVAFDHAMSPVLRDCVELHPQASSHVPRPLVFPRAVIASLAIEPSSSPSPPSSHVGAPPLALSAHPTASPTLPLPPIGWSTLEPPSTLLPTLAHYSTPIHHTPHILPPSLWATIPPSRSPQ
jgi:small nuclear ribonucleoprotein (snRNP)-like protein